MLERCVAFYRGPLSGESWRLFGHVILSRLRFEACLARSGYSLALELVLRWIWVCGVVQRCFYRRVASDAFKRCGRMVPGVDAGILDTRSRGALVDEQYRMRA
jgi:hypothetical protein